MIFIALGTNLGDRAAMLDKAVKELAVDGVKTLHRSSNIETPALLPPGSPPDWNRPYLNCVLDVDTTHRPLPLLDILKNIEVRMGRLHRGVWGPREIDLDLITYHKEVIDSETLKVPHAQLPFRRFVLAPLAELAPDWKHPVLKKTATEMLNELTQ